MALAFLWLDALACSLLWIATSLAIMVRIRRKWMRILLWPIVWAPSSFYPCVFLLAAVMFQFVWKLEPSHFAGAVSLVFAHIVGVWLIFRLRRDGKSQPIPARWPVLPLLICLIASATIGYLYLRILHTEIRHHLESLDEKVNASYLAGASLPASPNENAAPIYEEAFKNLQQDDGSDVNNPPIGDATVFDPHEPATLVYLKRQAHTLELLRHAASLPACRFESDMQPVDQAMINALMKTFDSERKAILLLDLDAREQIANHNGALAITDVATLLKMSRHFMQRPTLISALSGGYLADLFGNEALAMALPIVNRRSELTELDFRSLTPIGKAVRQALFGEELYGLSMYISPLPSHSNPYTNNVEIDEPPRGPLGRILFLDVDQYLAWTAKLQNLILQPYFEVRDQLPTADGPNRVFGNCAKVWVLSDARCFETFAVAEARDACAQTAVAMTHYRLDRGTLPKKLNELVPKYLDAIPTDPFDGRSLRLAIKKYNYIIYSVGPDGVDDGGVDYWGNSDHKGDVIFTLAATPSPTTQP